MCMCVCYEQQSIWLIWVSLTQTLSQLAFHLYSIQNCLKWLWMRWRSNEKVTKAYNELIRTPNIRHAKWYWDVSMQKRGEMGGLIHLVSFSMYYISSNENICVYRVNTEWKWLAWLNSMRQCVFLFLHSLLCFFGRCKLHTLAVEIACIMPLLAK